MKNQTIILLLLSIIGYTACESDENVFQTNCDEVVIVDSELFNTTTSEFFQFIDASIEGDCMIVEYSASGCDGNSWVMKLIDSGAIKESNPIQRDLKLVLTNEELCQAVFTKEISFDLSPLQTSDNKILLNLGDEQYVYSY